METTFLKTVGRGSLCKVNDDECSATREAAAMRSLSTAVKSSLCSLRLEKARAQQEDPVRPNINK